MLTEERHSAILRIVDEQKSVTVARLTELLGTSESTIRRDLTTLDRLGKLNKVHGGATSIASVFTTHEDSISDKYQKNTQEKMRIAKFAASLVKKNDFVFLDAGTSTEFMVDYLSEKGAVYVTGGIHIARKLARSGFQALILAGKVKASTDAIIGGESLHSLSRYNFTVGFFGTNSVHPERGFTTPDIEEARTKTKALHQCKRAYVLADSTKFGKVSSVTFAGLSDAAVITTALDEKIYRNYTKILEVDRDDLYRNL